MKSESPPEPQISDAQRGAIHSAVMAVLSVPAYFFLVLAISRMVDRGDLSDDTYESIGLVFLIFILWNAVGLFLGVRALASARAFRPLGVFAATIHFIILSMALTTLLG
jgi:hypothetical protein